MADRGTAVYFPDTLGELLLLARREPDALIYSGGTFILNQRVGRFADLPPAVISLQDVEELKRVSRSERYLEIGAALPIRDILALGRSNVPECLYSALRMIGPSAVASLATLGGNIAVPGRVLTSVPVLSLLDARVELRRQGASRWLAVSRVHRPNGNLELAESEVITRVRIPLQPWSIEVFRRFGSELAPESEPLSFCGLARTSNRIIEEIRIIGSAGLPAPLRDRDVESELVGRRIPLAERDISTAVEVYQTLGTGLTPIQRDRFVRLVQWFLLNLPAS